MAARETASPPLHVDIGVGGRFHSDHLYDALAGAGHDVTLFTTFPASRFPRIPRERVHSFLFPEIVFRLSQKAGLENRGDLFKMARFGRWMAGAAAAGGRRADCFIGWSSFSLETLRARHASVGIVVRDSAHIAFQDEVLSREYARLGLAYPDRRVAVARETEEYGLADRILVPSRFALKTFTNRGFAGDRLGVLPLGADNRLFHPGPDRLPRLPLEVVYFGTLSVQKGVHHLLEATREFAPGQLRLELIGSISPEFRRLLARYPHARHSPPVPHVELARRLRQKDVFVFPSLHDGFGQVVVQALAAGVPVIASDACGASEAIEDGKNGFVVRAGDPAAIRRQLLLLTEDLARLIPLRRAAVASATATTWDAYAKHVTAWIGSLVPARRAS